MTRWAAMGMGAMAAAALFSGMAGVRAEEDEPQRRVEIVRVGGGGARLGVVIEDVHADDVARLKLPEERGAVVKEVGKGSAAEKAGLKEGDVVLGYQGEKVWSAEQLRRLVRETPAGRHVGLDVSRAGAVQRLTASLEERKDRDLAFDDSFRFDVPTPPVPPIPPMPPLDHLLQDGDRGRRLLFRERLLDGRQGRLGLSYQEVSGQLARYFKVDDGGLLVTEVEESGPAASAGIRAGDVIVKFGGKAVTDAEDLRRSLREADAGSEVTLTVQRDGRPVELKATLRGERRIRGSRSTT